MKMTDITKKRIRYEILEDVESMLMRRVEDLERDNEYNRDPENWGGLDEMPEWRKDDLDTNTFRINEIQDIIKALSKL